MNIGFFQEICVRFICYVSISSVCPNPDLSSLMTYHRVRNKSNTTGATSGAGTDYPFEFQEGC
jgi:hypothetical protein